MNPRCSYELRGSLGSWLVFLIVNIKDDEKLSRKPRFATCGGDSDASDPVAPHASLVREKSVVFEAHCILHVNSVFLLFFSRLT
ncbi:hypothetical protein Y032_0014g2236 [Ancylostoma ceylanicum]|uniref:Uncharacterized protein n=1 Tax=Ancylostoma ceylanicum TaxID=53326 RepID=A0A016VB60_9BILA|nr:hypothetical protein Y032_0014g2236 [Ancylostoma ceylanicum]